MGYLTPARDNWGEKDPCFKDPTVMDGEDEGVRSARVDPLLEAYNELGILKYQSMDASGESFFLSRMLPRLLRTPQPIFMDVGANVGRYSKALRSHYKNAVIYAIEPNPAAFEALRVNLGDSGILMHNMGLSDREESSQLYNYGDDPAHAHACLYEEVLSTVHGVEQITSQPVTLMKLDDFCRRQSIEKLDFLKIDTEGHELFVLRGASEMLGDRRIGVIQFEFNEMNVISRVWLKDFYELLRGYAFFRLDSRRLIYLGGYTPRNEIFQYQNIVAIPTSIRSKRNLDVTSV